MKDWYCLTIFLQYVQGDRQWEEDEYGVRYKEQWRFWHKWQGVLLEEWLAIVKEGKYERRD